MNASAHVHLRNLCLGIAICACLVSLGSMRAQSSIERLVLIGGRVFASPESQPIDNGAVVIENGRILAVGPRERVVVPAGARRIDCDGLTILAGFQNSHVHFTEDKWNDAGKQTAAKLTGQLSAMFLRYGFTTVVDTTSLLSNTVELRNRIAAGDVAGPRILTAGLALYPPNGVPYYVKEVVPPELFSLLLQPGMPGESRAMVRSQSTSGADIVKLFTGSNVTRSQVVSMPLTVARAAVTEAHSRKELVFAHPGNVAGLEVAIAAGVDVLAHVVEGTSGLTETHLQQMNRSHMSLVPTLKLLGDGDDRRTVRNEVRDFARLGGEILFGTDVGFLSDYDPLREYELLAASGLNWRQVLASLTTSPANRFGEAKRHGRIAAGLEADIVVLARDPSQNVHAFTDVLYTIRSGRVVYAR
jgi:imidazolonepropionase-like amidohydrolase